MFEWSLPQNGGEGWGEGARTGKYYFERVNKSGWTLLAVEFDMHAWTIPPPVLPKVALQASLGGKSTLQRKDGIGPMFLFSMLTCIGGV